MSAFIPTSKGGLALFLVLGLMMGAAGVEQGHAGNEQITASELELPDAEAMSIDSTVLPAVVEDGYTRLVMNMLNGMVAYLMWIYSHGHALGQSLQWMPRVIITAGMRVAFSVGLIGFFVIQLRNAKNTAREAR